MTWPKIIAIASHKGGVAKTTTCLSLGGSLAEQGKSVLLIDLDPQSHLTLSLGLNPEELHHTIRDAFLGNVSLVSVTRETGVPLLDLAPANQGLSVLDKLLYGRPNYEYFLKNRLDATDSGYYDIVLIDSPPSFGTLILNALTAAELLITPTQCEYSPCSTGATRFRTPPVSNWNARSPTRCWRRSSKWTPNCGRALPLVCL